MNSNINQNPKNKLKENYRYILLAASFAIFLAIMFGSVTRVTGAGLSCPDWPTCFGMINPPSQSATAFNLLHRFFTVIATGMLILSAWIGNRYFSDIKLINRPLTYAVFLVGVEIIMGAAVVIIKLPPLLVAFHLGVGLVILGLTIIPTVMTFVLKFDAKQADRMKFQSVFSRLVIAAMLSNFLVLLTGTAVAMLDSSVVCINWPFCESGIIPLDFAGWLHAIHRILVLISGVVVIILFTKAWRSQRTQRAILASTTLVTSLYIAQILVGAFFAIEGYSATLLGLHAITVAALWATLVILYTFTGLAARSEAEEQAEAALAIDLEQRRKDMLSLTKPIIVVLLLVTTYTGMVLGAKQIPGLAVTFWTMLGGLFAAGGSGAVNQYIDRELDQRMTRTASRPIASGRMTAAEGLAFGLGLLVAAFYIMALFVNLLAALLSLFGMLYYIILYSLMLKTTTDQNIVIGGGAGAIPPLVGWAAVTGTLAIPALFLFAIIFMWTPPHFWALALVRKNDYAKAGIPMMPVVRGEKATQLQIFIYTIELVALTILMPLLNQAGNFFLVAAIVLGGGLIYLAWRVWREGGNKLAWKMYRLSSMYLAFLFAALMIDVLI